MKKLYVIDAYGYLYRSYFAIGQMTNPKGESTNAVYGFIRCILKIFKDFAPDHLVAVFDGPQGTKSREALYPDYKAHREAMPEDLRYQVEWAHRFCDLRGIAQLNIAGCEADDAIGSVARWASGEGAKVYICSTDKDMAQLVDENVHIINTFKDNLELGPEQIEETYGIPPDKMIDWLAITGDSADNVPGIRGFGPKTATALLQEFGSLDAVIAGAESIQAKKRRETLIAESDKALLSRKLVTIDTSIPFEQSAEFFRIKSFEKESLDTFYADLNFTTLRRDLHNQKTPQTAKPDADPKPLPPKKQSSDQLVLEFETAVSYTLVDDTEGLEKLVKFLSQAKEICFDTETTSARPMLAELVGLGFSVEAHNAFYVPVNGKLGLDAVLKALKPLFENPNLRFFGHNIKYDAHVLANYSITLTNISFDTILASYILNAHNRRHSLDYLALHYFKKQKTPIEELIGKGKKQITMRDVPIDKVCHYCCEDVDYTLRLKKILSGELKTRELSLLLTDLELPLLRVLLNMERKGVYVDINYLEEMGRKLVAQLQKLEAEIHELAGESFNIKSPKQLSEILFKKMGIAAPRKTATGLSTNAEVLETLKDDYPIAGKVLEFRTLEKLRSTYIETLPGEVNPKTGRIHCTFNQSVAATGRLSSQDPNLQNIPVRTEIGRQIRGAFRPQKPDWSFLAADYSQIELRLLAHLSEDPKLMEAFEHGKDVHAHTASQIFATPLEQVTKEQRYHAKAVNFGVIYGQQAFGLARELHIDMKSASAFIKAYFERYVRVLDFIEQCKTRTRNTGKAVTITGRERAIPEIHSKNNTIRSAAERLAVNTPLQGTAADLIKMAMLKVAERLKSSGLKAKMLLQIHDELIFEAPDAELEELKSLVTNTMEQAYPLKVPLIVDVDIGKNWQEC